jgi:hypothetical protein
VVEKSDPGLDVGGAAPVDIQTGRNPGLLGYAFKFSGTFHPLVLARDFQ